MHAHPGLTTPTAPAPTCTIQFEAPAGPHPGCEEFTTGPLPTLTCGARAQHGVRVIEPAAPAPFGEFHELVCGEHLWELVTTTGVTVTRVEIAEAELARAYELQEQELTA